jgi:hypothetical protein
MRADTGQHPAPSESKSSGHQRHVTPNTGTYRTNRHEYGMYSPARWTFLACVVSSPNDNQRNHHYTPGNDRLTDSRQVGNIPERGCPDQYDLVSFCTTSSFCTPMTPRTQVKKSCGRLSSISIRLSPSVELRNYPVRWEVESGRRPLTSSDLRT